MSDAPFITAETVCERLRQAAQTETNDDTSQIGSEKRARYVERIDAMLAAIEFITAQAADIARLTEEPPEFDDNHMMQIAELIKRLQNVHDRWGNTCIYIRRGGLSWGALALNRCADDEKYGTFDLQAQHDRDMTARLEQIERLMQERDDHRSRSNTAEENAAECHSRAEAAEASLAAVKAERDKMRAVASNLLEACEQADPEQALFPKQMEAVRQVVALSLDAQGEK